MKKISCLIILTTLFLHAAPAHAEERLRLGVSAPLVGDGATFGSDLLNVLRFANKTLTGGAYEIVAEEDHCEGKSAVTVAHKLLAMDRVSAVFFACDTAALTTAPIYGKRDVLVVSPLVTSPRFSGLGPRFFRLAPNDADNARMLVGYIAGRHHKLGILTEGASEYAEDLGIEVEKAAGRAQLAFVHERFGPQTRDFRPLLLRLRSAGIDSLLINPTTDEPFLAALRDMQTLHLKLPVFGAYAPGSLSFREKAGEMADGVVFTDFPVLPPLDEKGQSLFEQYKAEFGPLRSWDFLFATGYESLRIVDEALRSGRDPSSYIHETTFHGLFGDYSFDERGDIRSIKNVLWRIDGGKVVAVTAENAREARE